MPLSTELAQLRARLELLQDLTYRLQATVDRMEQYADQQQRSAPEPEHHDQPF